MNRPAGKRKASAVEAAADVVCKRRFARIIHQVAIGDAHEKSYSGYDDRRQQRPPHVSSTMFRVRKHGTRHSAPCGPTYINLTDAVPGIDGRLPKYRFITRNNARMAAWPGLFGLRLWRHN